MIIFLFILSFIPNFIWLVFFLKEDPNPEPKKSLIIAFLLGILAALVCFPIELGLNYIFINFLGFDIIENYLIYNGEASIFEIFTYSLIGIALVEEIIKFLMAKLMLFKNPVFDEPVDAMIYLVVIALGFAFFENFLVVLGNYLNDVALLETIGILVYRFIGANLLHVISSGIIGFYWAKGIILKNQKKSLTKGIIIAVILHGLFNSILVIFNEFAYVFILIILFIASLILLKNFEALKQFNVPATLINPSYYQKLKKQK
ncbi:MAG TPA: PrsW family glutamic-type intramembrane protease [Candidatus Paceibacterota bacterium]|nr:PrsW family glutamic-type intramembrane protease [Candidatus Paceibacterota bacterium]